MKTLKLISISCMLSLAFAGNGHAQVTVYGTINTTYESISAHPNIASSQKLSDSGSFIGFRGTEDFGGGVSAYFVLQNLIDVSGSSAPVPISSNGFTDASYVGLRTSLGSIQFGYFPVYNPVGIVKWDGAAVYMGQATWLLPLVHSNGQTFGSTAGGRTKNTVQYSTPEYKGMQAQLYFARPDESRLPNGTQGKLFGITTSYQNGPWTAMYNHITEINTTPAVVFKGFNVKADRITFNYNQAAGLNASLLIDRNKNDDPLIKAGLKRTTVGLPVWYKDGPHTVAMTYAHASNVSGIANSGSRFIMVGYSYALSKRTNIYADFAKISNDENGHYDFQTNAEIGGMGAPPTLKFLLPGGADPRTFQIGTRHAF